MNSSTLIELTQQHGTPLYVYDGSIIRRQVKSLQDAFADVDMRIKYACKANTNLAILRLMRELGVEIDVVSMGEMQMALLAGYAPEQLTFTPSGVPFEEVREAVEAGAKINVDSLPLLEWFGQNYGDTQPCLIRLKPNVAAGGNAKIMTGHSDSKFGISVLLLDDIMNIVERYNLKIIGLHQHTGSDIKEADAFLQASEVIFKAAMRFPDLEIIDLGGGFKVSYKPGDTTTDMQRLGAEITRGFQDFCQSYGRELQLWFEPGKYLVSECGQLLVQATVIKEDPARDFVHVDSGLNHLIRPMMYGSYHHILNLSNPDGPARNYDVVGYICETDTFATDRELPEVRPGDILAFLNAGAYGFTMSSHYNARYRPAEVLVDEGEARLVRRHETLDDLLRTQLDLN
ncbi:diaminopimelate decarboxylase [Persicitalea jodogahamensis]|uniref:Diaminopimelate decarboxylase n=1 Tax=Persicitalea jodogahamensis TaxID=402147 RepID=A0A8J3DBF6_9BACT|nr:diaminopimelate decarboxylase [Persicitalea jodogahamensis]GHB78253.1 diaminopimelate decarboxylase [Persicitalea jodogahamensis]